MNEGFSQQWEHTKWLDHIPTKEFFDDGSDVWQFTFIWELRKTIRANDEVDFYMSMPLDIWEHDHCKD